MLSPGIRRRMKIGRLGDVRSRPVPNEYSEAVEQWAREHGGHATLKWLPTPMNCWAIILSFKVGDPRQGGPEDGEPVLLHEYWTAKQWQQRAPKKVRRHWKTNAVMAGNYAFELDELGVEGIIRWLDRGNVLSGRGQFKSVEHAGKVSNDNHEAAQAKARAEARDNAGQRFKDGRRQALKIPFLPVRIEFGSDGSISRQPTKET